MSGLIRNDMPERMIEALLEKAHKQHAETGQKQKMFAGRLYQAGVGHMYWCRCRRDATAGSPDDWRTYHLHDTVLVVTPVLFSYMKERALKKGTLELSKMAGWMK